MDRAHALPAQLRVSGFSRCICPGVSMRHRRANLRGLAMSNRLETFSPAALGDRSVLFLQGPPGPLFRELGARFAKEGARVHRINVSGGDRFDWPAGATDYTGSFNDWSLFLDSYLAAHKITDLFMFGDCRPYHEVAHRLATEREVRIWVLEEGYIRPHWMTLELHGVNGNSLLPRNPHWYRQEAKLLPQAPEPPAITASFGRRARDSYWHYHHSVTGRLRFRHYRTHREVSTVGEGVNWLRRLSTVKARQHQTRLMLKTLRKNSYFLFPLQLSSDYQIKRHSAFETMDVACRYVIESFASHAPQDLDLLIKVHPLDCAGHVWPRFIDAEARRLGVRDRVKLIDGGNLTTLAKRSRGVVTVNSTSGTLALANGVPVKVLGDAVYDIPDITDQQHIDSFWGDPQPPDADTWNAFHRVLLDRCLIEGGIASQSAVRVLTDSIIGRFRSEPSPRIAQLPTTFAKVVDFQPQAAGQSPRSRAG